ncbi:MAG: hypothetical protein DWQ01_09315 [Planctomycetota bacterium]|nr:MAG: hypothetical protein DWQ01_09315 [Planctomycetota bacterium]
MRHFPWFIGGLALAGFSCATYDGRYQFQPQPQLSEAVLSQHDASGSNKIVARAWVSLDGLRLPDPEQGLGRELEVSMEVENLSEETLRLAAQEMRIMTAGMVKLDSPRFALVGSQDIAPGEAQDLDLFFSLPENRSLHEINLSSLTLLWAVYGHQGPASGTVTFERKARATNPGALDGPFAAPWFGMGIYPDRRCLIVNRPRGRRGL